MARSPDLSRLFRQPESPAHRRYEVCRAYFLESAPAEDIARRFQLHADTVRAIVRDFARDPDIASLFAAAVPGPKTAPKRDAIRDRACELRRRGITLPAIRATLREEGLDVSESYLFRLLQRSGLTATRRRAPPQPGESAADGSIVPDVADARACRLEEGRRFPTDAAGLFLFTPLLLELDLPHAVLAAGLPGSEQIPPLQAGLALLAP
jgi:transposase